MKSHEYISNAHQQLKAIRQLLESAKDLHLVESSSFAILIESIELNLSQGLDNMN